MNHTDQIELAVATLVASHATPPNSRAPLEPSPNQDLSAELVRLIQSKPWRRSAVDADTSRDIRAKVSSALANKLPLEFSIPFGGYKARHQASFPHLNWAEVMWLDYLRRYGRHLARHYEPGVLFSLSYFHGVLGFVNNLRLEDQTCYVEELTELAARMSDDRVSFRLHDLSEHYGGIGNTLAALSERYHQYLRHWPLPLDEREKKIASAMNNLVKTGGCVDMSNIPADKLLDIITDAAMRCDALESLEKRREFNKFSTRIQITHVRGPSLAIHLGTCRTSVSQAWVADGYLEPTANGELVERIQSARPAGGTRSHAVDHGLNDVSPALARITVLSLGN